MTFFFIQFSLVVGGRSIKRIKIKVTDGLSKAISYSSDVTPRRSRQELIVRDHTDSKPYGVYNNERRCFREKRLIATDDD